MDLRDLRYFETVAGLEHVGQASAKLHRTQPAITSAIRRLEGDCGVPLFERAGRGIRLTAAGRVLLKWAQRIRFDADDAKREMASIAAEIPRTQTLISEKNIEAMGIINRYDAQKARFRELKEQMAREAAVKKRPSVAAGG